MHVISIHCVAASQNLYTLHSLVTRATRLSRESDSLPVVPKDTSAVIHFVSSLNQEDQWMALKRKLTSRNSMQKMYNVVVFGETGVGKSSIVNLITGRDVAEVSSDAVGCTKEVKDYEVTLDSALYHIWDTPGLESAQTISEEHQASFVKAYGRIWKLQCEGGVDLLVYCITGRRSISVNLPSTVQTHYRLFYELLCGTKVPVVLVVTEPERGGDEWWEENKKRLQQLDIKASGHVCITSDLKESMAALRNLLTSCTARRARQHPSVRENLWWPKEVMKSLLDPKMFPQWKKMGIQERTVLHILVSRCGLDTVEAGKLVKEMGNYK